MRGDPELAVRLVRNQAHPKLDSLGLEATVTIDPIALSSVAAAVSVLRNEYLKGIATDAGKATWTGIKHLLGWTSDPAPDEISQKVKDAVTISPQITEKLLDLLKNSQSDAAKTLVGRIEVSGGKVVVANNINQLKM